jgi:hypothetical protein
MRSTIRSYHAAGSLSLPLASVFTLSLEAFAAEAFPAEALEEGLVVPAANDTTGWRHTGHVLEVGFVAVRDLANHRRMHAV